MADKSSPQYISDKRKQQIFDNLIDYVSEHTTDEKDFYYSLRDIIGLTNEEMTQLGIDVKSLGINDEEDDLEESKKITEDTEFYTDEALKVLDYIQNEMTNEQRKKLFKDECGDFESGNEADQLKEFWDWIELLDSDDIEELGDKLNIIEEPEYQSDKELDEEENMDKKNATDFTPLNKVLTGNRGLSQDEIDIIRRNINRKAEYLDGYKNLPDEDKQEDCELNLREMIMSCLVYGSDPKNNKYVKPYYDKLEKDTVDKIIKDQTEYFERGEVVSAGQDSEGNSYNSFLDPKTVKPLFYGVPNVYMISHGEWADPELEYKDHLFNYYDLENLLNEEYEECKNSGEIDKNISFEKYVKDNQNYIYDCLDTQIEADLENRNEEIYGNLNKTNLQKAFNYIKEILNTQNNDTERDGFYYPEKAVELVELNSKIIISPFFDFTTSDELELINNNTTVEEAIDSLFDKDSPYSEEHARVYGNNFTSCLNKIANKELHLSNEDEESEER